MRWGVSVLLLGLAACDPQGPTAPDPAFELIPGFSTTLNPDAILAMGGVKTFETLNGGERDPRPRMDNVILDLDGVVMFNERVHVTFDFYNDVMMEACVVASTPAASARIVSGVAAHYRMDARDLSEETDLGKVDLNVFDGPDGAARVCATIESVREDLHKWVRVYS